MPLLVLLLLSMDSHPRELHWLDAHPHLTISSVKGPVTVELELGLEENLMPTHGLALNLEIEF